MPSRPSPGEATAPINILLVEDSDIDTDLIQIHLRSLCLPFRLKRVDQRTAYLEALGSQRFDVILADYSLPDFDGLSALHLARQTYKDIPFIFVSGVVGEDFATGALREGATDYVLKRTLQRLPRAVERAVAEMRERAYRQRVEGALRRSEVSVRLAVEAARVGMWAVYPQTGEVTLDSRCRALYGLSIEEPVAFQALLGSIHPADRARIAKAIESVVTATMPMEFDQEYRVVPRHGGERWLHTRGQSFLENGKCTRFLGVMQDVTEQKRAADALLRANETLEATVEERTRERDRVWQLSRDLMLVGWFDRPPLELNPAWTATLGWSVEELMAAPVLEHVHAEDRERTRIEITRAGQGQPTRPFEIRLRHKDGSFRAIAWSVVASGDVLHAVGRDVTQERAAQEQLRQAQKMETIGQLTGGVAHDFNNLLTVIAGNLETVQRFGADLPDPEGSRIRNAAANAVHGAERAATLTQRLLAFARRQPLNPKPVDVNRLIEGMSDLLHRTLGEHIAIHTLLGPRLWHSHVDPNQLEVAVLNLAVNARDAMGNGGQLTIETANTRLDVKAAARAELAAGDYVVVAVTDTGTGMTEGVLGQAFEPFFTTKDIGHGTGLGLSQVYGFVKQTGGHVKIHTRLGRGTTVKLYLPSCRSSHGDEAPVAPSAAPTGRHGETILVVEDDEDVRNYSTELLGELGYRCLVAANSQAALAILRNDVEVTLLFTDMGLPGGLNGRELAQAARRLRPGLKVLFTSGYATQAIVHGDRLDPGVELISKPFTYQALAAHIRGVLDRPSLSRTILIIEDEALIRALVAELLQEEGFATLEAGSGREAMTIVESGESSIDAVILDLGLPDMTGDEVARNIRSRQGSALPIVIATGHDSISIRERFAGDNRLDVIQKPYARSAMLDALARLRISP
ncbi:PAS domain S-box-containing protein [Arboricoccus pini]|uniref:histidine kinase n=1 Tax=Arboricoccus pini TaxID=1963835 RepID=A0A212R6F0_9PROT|nr:response regulator [Arboricoccus pini]SNB67645.1 PAS domain S-box-containing protein [Arboricoccus pini]